jgi:hypothetical protein
MQDAQAATACYACSCRHGVLCVQLRVYGVALCVFVTATCVLWFVGSDACVNYVVTWLGMIPLIIAMTSLVLIGLYVTMPREQSFAHHAWGSVWLMQHFAWTERSKPRKVAERAAALRELRGLGDGPSSPARGGLTPRSPPPPPMFCFETCIKLFFWAALIYDYTEAEGHTFSTLSEPIRVLLGEIDAAMRLYDLVRRRLFYDRRRGTKVLVAWNESTIVVTIRGSAERANFYEDAKVRGSSA